MRGGEDFGKVLERRRKQGVDKARAAWLLACALSAPEFGGDVRVVMQGNGKRGRGSDAVTAKCRKVACYLASVVADAAPEQLAKASGLNRSTIHKHVQEVEDWRDDLLFDKAIEGLEAALFGMAARVVLARLGELPEPEAER